MIPLLPMDAHAHIQTVVSERDLRELRAVVFAVTREPSEWRAAAGRRDRSCVWGLGCHPAVERAAKTFDPERLHDQVQKCPVIGEVGLERRSTVPQDRQLTIFRAVLDVARARPRLVSIHSFGRSCEVLRELETRPITGAILHWWRGSPDETRMAIELGCYFSLNGAEARNPKVLSFLPPERVLTETDYPHTRESDQAAAKPGALATIESALAAHWGEDVQGVRRRVWLNLGELCRATSTSGLMPRTVQATMLTLR